MSIKIFYDDVNFRIRNWRKIKVLIEKVIAEEGKIPGDLNFILTNDKILKEINIEFLQHYYCTDVISFNHEKKGLIAGEIYISIETVKVNAKNYKVSYNNELLRVFLHGLLHLCEYDDQTEAEKRNMRKLEDSWLEEFKRF